MLLLIAAVNRFIEQAPGCLYYKVFNLCDFNDFICLPYPCKILASKARVYLSVALFGAPLLG
jgi:hypothetical protein